MHPELAAHVPQLAALGIDLAVERLGDEELHEVGFRRPVGTGVSAARGAHVLAAGLRRQAHSQLGYFEEFGLPTPDLERSTAFWDALGFVAFDPVRAPFTRVVVAGRDLNVGLYDVDLRTPVLTFSDPAMPERIAALRERGLRFAERLPRGMEHVSTRCCSAPEGTCLLLTTGEE